MKEQSIIFDFDDTLGGVRMPDGSIRGTTEAYTHCAGRAADLAEAQGISREEFLILHNDIDSALALDEGFRKRDRFAESLALTYDVFRPGDLRVSRAIYDIGLTVFTDYAPVPLPGALRVLKELHDHYRIYVVTKGHHDEQMRKLRETGIRELIDDVVVCERKSDAEWREVVANLGWTLLPDHGLAYAAEKSWAVGNSPRWDVNPLLRLGFNGIHVVQDSHWAFDHDDLSQAYPGRVVRAVTTLDDLLRHIPLTH